MEQEILLNTKQRLYDGILTEADFFVPNVENKEKLLNVGYEIALLAFQAKTEGIDGIKQRYDAILQEHGFNKERILLTLNLDHYLASCVRVGQVLAERINKKDKSNFFKNTNFMEGTFGKLLKYFLIISIATSFLSLAFYFSYFLPRKQVKLENARRYCNQWAVDAIGGHEKASFFNARYESLINQCLREQGVSN